jgi:hypothetical protein
MLNVVDYEVFASTETLVVKKAKTIRNNYSVS